MAHLYDTEIFKKVRAIEERLSSNDESAKHDLKKLFEECVKEDPLPKLRSLSYDFGNACMHTVHCWELYFEFAKDESYKEGGVARRVLPSLLN